MKSLKSLHRKTFFWALFLSVGFVLGILGIIFGATKGITILLVLGIIFTVLGFYAMPIIWIQYGEQTPRIAVLDLIVNDNMLNLDSIAQSLGKRLKDIQIIVNYLMTKRFLKGYVLDGNVLKPIENNEDVVVTHKCPYCGATLDLEKDISSCEYCGAKLKIKIKNKGKT